MGSAYGVTILVTIILPVVGARLSLWFVPWHLVVGLSMPMASRRPVRRAMLAVYQDTSPSTMRPGADLVQCNGMSTTYSVENIPGTVGSTVPFIGWSRSRRGRIGTRRRLCPCS